MMFPYARQVVVQVYLLSLIADIGVAHISSRDDRVATRNATLLPSISIVEFASTNDRTITSILVHEKLVAILVEVELSHAAEA